MFSLYTKENMPRYADWALGQILTLAIDLILCHENGISKFTSCLGLVPKMVAATEPG